MKTSALQALWILACRADGLLDLIRYNYFKTTGLVYVTISL